MNSLSQKVLDVLMQNGVDRSNVLEKLSLIYKDLEISLWENIVISPILFYSLKDIVWYNLEHLPNNGESLGISDLRFLGTVFPHLIYCCNDNNSISLEQVPLLLQELETITQKWNKDWKFVNLYTKSQEGWNGGENPSKVIIFDKKIESPSKYGYNSTYGSIVSVDGKNIKKYDLDTVLCSVDSSIGEFVNGQILYSLLNQLKETCKKAIKNKKDILVIYNQENSF